MRSQDISDLPTARVPALGRRVWMARVQAHLLSEEQTQALRALPQEQPPKRQFLTPAAVLAQLQTQEEQES